MANVLKEFLWITRPSSIGVSGGRGAYYTARNLLENPIKLGGTEIMPLAGYMSGGNWKRNIKDDLSYLNMDPDYIVQIMGHALGTSQDNMMVLKQRLAYNTEKERNIILNKEGALLSVKHWPTNAPEVIVMGIGTLEGGHRYRNPDAIDLEPIRRPLEQLNTMIDNAKEKLGYTLVLK